MAIDPVSIKAWVELGIAARKELEEVLNNIREPGAVVEVVNTTARTFSMLAHNFAHGGFGPGRLPKRQIGPFQSDAFLVVASGIGTGIEGSVTYNAAGAGDILIGFSIPFVGTNTVNANAGPGFDNLCSCLGLISAESHAHARFDMLPRVAGFPEIQQEWRSCPKCQGLHFAGFPGKGVCPAGGAHEQTGSFAYGLLHGTTPSANVQTGWRSCPKCQGLHFPGPSKVHLHIGKGVCPAGGEHEQTGSFDYAVTFDTASADRLQLEWRSCRKCQGLFFGPQRGRCPDGGEHDGNGSFNYGLRFA